MYFYHKKEWFKGTISQYDIFQWDRDFKLFKPTITLQFLYRCTLSPWYQGGKVFYILVTREQFILNIKFSSSSNIDNTKLCTTSLSSDFIIGIIFTLWIPFEVWSFICVFVITSSYLLVSFSHWFPFLLIVMVVFIFIHQSKWERLIQTCTTQCILNN